MCKIKICCNKSKWSLNVVGFFFDHLESMYSLIWVAHQIWRQDGGEPLALFARKWLVEIQNFEWTGSELTNKNPAIYISILVKGSGNSMGITSDITFGNTLGIISNITSDITSGNTLGIIERFLNRSSCFKWFEIFGYPKVSIWPENCVIMHLIQT